MPVQPHVIRLALLALWVTSGACGAGGDRSGAGGAAGSAGQSGGAPGPGGAPGEGGSQSTGGSSAAGRGGGTGGAATGGAAGAGGVGQAGASAAGRTGSSGSGGGPGGGAGAVGRLAQTPYMGWSSWSSQTGGITEAKVKAVADVMAAKLAAFGYQYVNIDDGWYDGFDGYGRWKPDARKFPDGISGAAAYLHSKGLKIGIYLTPGVNDTVVSANSPIEGTTFHVKDIVTSAAGNTDRASGATARKIDYSKPGAAEYVQAYANLLASWGVDFIKMDFVGPGGGGGSADNRDDIQHWRAALDRTGRSIWLELSNMLSISAIDTWRTYSNGWRVANDVECYCSTLTNWAHVVRVINAVPPFVSYAGPGHWNDLDSLELGAGSGDGLTAAERQTMFSFWAITAAPLYIGADITSLDAADQAILTNPEVIAVDQTAVPARPVSTSSNQQVWHATQPDGSIVVGLFNFDATPLSVTARFSDVGAAGAMNVRDLVSRTDLGRMSTSFSATLASHASRLLKLTP